MLETLRTAATRNSRLRAVLRTLAAFTSTAVLDVALSSSAAAQTTQPVEWTSLVNASGSPGVLTKTGVDGWDAGGVSTKGIVSTDGYFEFRATTTDAYRMAGLSRGDRDQNYGDIDYAIYAAWGGGLHVYEGGVRRGSFGTYAAGDLLRVGVENGVVVYRKNGAVLYTSAVAPGYPLLVDTSLYSAGASIAEATIAGTLEQVVEPVEWTSLVNASGGPGLLTKTGPDGWDAGGGVSTRGIASTDGYFEFRATTTDAYRMAGLSRGDNRDQSYGDIDYAIYAALGGGLHIYEGGVSRGAFGTYAAGDLLRVGVESGVVVYRKNGVVLYTSAVAPSYPLLVDASLYSMGASISEALIAGTLEQVVEPVEWTSVVNATGSPGVLTKTGGDGWDAGGVSTKGIVSTDGYLEFRPTTTSGHRMAGLSRGDTDQGYSDIDYALYPASGGGLYIYESGVSRGQLGTYAAGDLLRVGVDSGVVVYRKNGVVLYTSAVAPSYPLLVDTSLYSIGASINEAVIAGTLAEVRVSTPVLSVPTGSYPSALSVAVTVGTPGGIIHHTLDGTEPTTSSPVYSTPFTISTTTIVKAKAFAAGYLDSDTTTGTYTLQVGAPAFDSAPAVSVDLGVSDAGSGVTRVPVAADGNTVADSMNGLSCVRNADAQRDRYIYFDVADTFAFQGNRPSLYLSIHYFDTGSGSLLLEYDAPESSYKPASRAIDLQGTNRWRSRSFHLTDAYLGNRQNGGADFRIWHNGEGFFYVDLVYLRDVDGGATVFISPAQNTHEPPNPQPRGKPWRDALTNPGLWESTRSKVDVLVSADAVISEAINEASVDEARSWFSQMQQWGLGLGLEVGAIKEWPGCWSGQECFNTQKNNHWNRFRDLGATISLFAMDEPLNCVLNTPDCSRTGLSTREDAVRETAEFMRLVRATYPTARLASIEPHPTVGLQLILWWVLSLNDRCAELGIQGLDYFSVDLDWSRNHAYDAMRLLHAGLEYFGIPFSITYWAASTPTSGSDADWYNGVMRQGAAIENLGIRPQNYWLNSWLKIPKATVPETADNTFMRAANDFISRFVQRHSPPPPPPECGNTSCEAGETCAGCAADCACLGGTTCQGGECVLQPPGTQCGNEICEENEDPTCIDCRVTIGSYCGNQSCEHGEVVAGIGLNGEDLGLETWCPEDCGTVADGTCTPAGSPESETIQFENCFSSPADCSCAEGTTCEQVSGLASWVRECRAPCVPNAPAFSLSATSVPVAQPVTFTVEPALIADPPVPLWDMGNAVHRSGNPLTYAYDVPGTYTVVLTVTESACLETRLISQSIVVGAPTQTCGAMGGEACSQDTSCPTGHSSLGRSSDCETCCDLPCQSTGCPAGTCGSQVDNCGDPIDCGPCIRCGDGICTSGAEDCGTCLQDCPCWQAGTVCSASGSSGQCVLDCGNPASHDHSGSCGSVDQCGHSFGSSSDCGCPGAVCCGDGVCTSGAEDCGTCLQDCPCWQAGTVCSASGSPGQCVMDCENPASHDHSGSCGSMDSCGHSFGSSTDCGCPGAPTVWDTCYQEVCDSGSYWVDEYCQSCNWTCDTGWYWVDDWCSGSNYVCDYCEYCHQQCDMDTCWDECSTYECNCRWEDYSYSCGGHWESYEYNCRNECASYVCGGHTEYYTYNCRQEPYACNPQQCGF